MRALRRGIDKAKRDIESWMLYYWARDTGHLVRRTIAWLHKNTFNDIRQMMNIAIGSNVDYAPYVYAMKGVNWTNPHTAKIEKKFISSAIQECKRALKLHITKELGNFGLDWMVGRGRLPNQLTTYTSRGNIKIIPRYRGQSRILQWTK